MKINLDFYNGKDSYSDGDIEEEIIEYTKKYDNAEYETIFKTDMRWPVFYHLTPIRQNIINWYEFKENSDVLEIGAGMGAITGILCDKAKTVTAVELSKRRAEAIEHRHKNRENLELIIGNLNDVKFNKKFDYITLIGVLEYASSFTNGNSPFADFLTYIKSLLKDDGKLLIAIENKLGMKYFAGSPEDHTNLQYDGIMGYQQNKRVKTFGKFELEELLQSVGLKYNKFYYPLPDYKLPNIVFSDDYLPTVNNVINYNPYYYENSNINFSEVLAYKEVVKNNMFSLLANSFFVESSQMQLEENIKFASFNNMRKSKYRMMTLIKTKKVSKRLIDDKSIEHFNGYLQNIEKLKKKGCYNLEKGCDNSIESVFIENFNSLKKVICDMYKNDEKDKFFEVVEKFRNELLKNNKSISYEDENIFNAYEIDLEDKEILSELNFMYDGFWDMIFQNCHYEDEKFYFFDQEWYNINVPVEFVLYRGIATCTDDLSSDDMVNIYEKLGITKYIDLFKRLESKIQMKIIDETMKHFYNRAYPNVFDIAKQRDDIIQEKEKQIQEYINELNNKDLIIAEQNKLKTQNEDTIRYMKNSRIWKYTKWLRNIKKK